VQVVREDQRIAFEVQLSTTFLTEIVGRREFYRLNHGAMIWVFQHFDPFATRTAEEDIFFLNNHNVFLVNDDTLARSQREGKMALDCWYAVPHLSGGLIVNEWIKEHVFLEQLTIRPDLQHVYYYDYQIRKRELETTLNVDTLRHDFHEFWMRFGHDDSADAKAPWAHIRERMKIVFPTIRLPESYWEGPFHGAVSIVLSARYGRPIGYRFDRLLNVTNTAFEYYKGFLLPFGWTLEVFEQQGALQDQDKKGTWARRRKEIRVGLQERDKAYQPDLQYNRLFAFLVPEIKERLLTMRYW
jgi:hypothetical protein